ncbi:glycoside hydrolase domain-containing protein [Mesobacillus maritimus]|uniref:glycoside hydrolase domain-containing protein n=1 Tax=Mesobacillus maritimus TaxID=1643336 RepID=UPI003D81BDE4
MRALGKNKLFTVVLSVFCTVILSFFVFAFVDFTASGPGGGTTPAEEKPNNDSEDKSSSEEESKEGNTEENKTNEEKNGKTDVTNDIENNVNSGEGGDSEVSNDVDNNVDGDNADVSNSIENNLENSDNNKIDNSVTNNINVSVNVNVSNDINNNANNDKDNKDNKGSTDGDKKENEDDNKNNNEEGNKEGDSGEDRLIWGVDSANLTTEDMLSCVEDNFGSPEIWGRYLGDKDGVSKGLTSAEKDLLHSNDIKILLIWNQFTDGTGYENGKNQAQAAIEMAKDLGAPEGVAIFADIEPDYPVDSEFIKGWYEVMNESQYEPGIYGVFDSKQDLYAALEQAGQENEELLKNTYVWTAAPSMGITTEDNAPDYNPEAPENALIGGWQYGLDASACTIDTNLFHSDILDVLW